MSKVEQQTEVQETAIKRITIHTDDAGKAIVRRAITLRLAMQGETCRDDPELHGAALVGIVSEWLRETSDRLREERV